MKEDKKDAVSGSQERAKAIWTPPVLIACGNMKNVLANEGWGGDASGGSVFSTPS